MKTGRNKPCPCGSGKKYKKCCIDKEQVSQDLLDEKIVQERIYKENQPLFELNDELRCFINKIINTKIKSPDDKQFFAIFALAKAYKTHAAVVKLCKDGFGEDAA